MPSPSTTARRTRTSAGRSRRAGARVALVDAARAAAGALPRLHRRRGDLRREHDVALVRALAHGGANVRRRATRSSSPVSTTTATSSPWLELAHDLGLVVRFADITDDCDVDLASLERLLSERTRVVAFPVASNAVGTLTDVARIVELAHSVGALAWADAVHSAPARADGRRRAGTSTSSSARRTSSSGRTSGSRTRDARSAEAWRPYKVRPQSDEPLGHRFETGTQPFELLAGFVAAVAYVESIGWEAIQAHERSLGERFLDGLPETVTLYGKPTMDGRVPTFAFTVDGVTPPDVAARLGEQGIAVWDGQLLRARGDPPARARGRRRHGARRLRPLQHRRRGRPPARRARRSVSARSRPGRAASRAAFASTRRTLPATRRACVEHVRRAARRRGHRERALRARPRSPEPRRPPRGDRNRVARSSSTATSTSCPPPASSGRIRPSPPSSSTASSGAAGRST